MPQMAKFISQFTNEELIAELQELLGTLRELLGTLRGLLGTLRGLLGTLRGLLGYQRVAQRLTLPFLTANNRPATGRGNTGRMPARMVHIVKTLPEKQYYSIAEIAEYAGYHRATVARWCKSGRIGAQMIGGNYRISRESLDDFMRIVR
jgi:excisionase family DNA binding protein